MLFSGPAIRNIQEKWLRGSRSRGWPKQWTRGLSIGIPWVGLTVAFDFLARHDVFGSTWQSLLVDYNLFHGRNWALVLPRKPSSSTTPAR